MPTISEDRDEILQVMYRYNHAIDGGDPDAWARCFTADGVFDVMGRVTTGRDALRALAANVNTDRGMRHLLTNTVIDVDGDTARGQAYVVMMLGGGFDHIGVYDDEYQRTPDGWRIAKRVYERDRAATAPA